ncbi:Glu-tRNA(Gln) amidotransferase subunit GatE [Candidatus Micrarchaeota archaeon]|nr:Glu-tRNA(Gln) amidotransferase subunit GatE [Candidatus Micrarchaeota archaeon]
MKCGIEIHQRLATEKLFCRCPSILSDSEPFKEIKRRLFVVESETGEIDRSAKEQQEKKQEFTYQIFNENCCLVETDEEPPHEMNKDALLIVLGIAQQMNSNIVEEVHTMRKLVIDGSNTSGFQRTSLIALGGKLETSEGDVGMLTLVLEEESAGIVSENNGSRTYRLDRLGIPLIEIATAPDIKNGKHAKEVAEKIGMMLRATGKVARGIGTIRQDLNVSIENGARVEVKGVQELKSIPLYVENEAKRQENLLVIIKELKSRLGEGWKSKAKPIELTIIFSSTKSKFISNLVKKGAGVFGIKLEKHSSLLGSELNPNRRYGSELSDYAKLAGVKGIIHSDEDMEKYSILESEWKEIQDSLNCSKEDGFAMVVAEKQTAVRAFEHVLRRAEMFFVPEETRKANPDGTSSYMRPLPGRARMYPETDIPLIKITKPLLSEARKTAGEGAEKKMKRLSSLLNEDLAKKIFRSPLLPVFEQLIKKGAEPKLAVTTLTETLVSLRREGFELKDLSFIEKVLSIYNEKKITKAAIPEIIKYHIQSKETAEAIIKKHNLGLLSSEEMDRIIKECKGDIKRIMSKYRLRLDPKELMKKIKGSGR